MLYAMLEASYHTSCNKIYFTKNAANIKDSTQLINDEAGDSHNRGVLAVTTGLEC
jgi:hypothetical protein